MHEDTTGGEFKRHREKSIPLRLGEELSVTFRISGHSKGDLLGYGTWFWCAPGVVRKLQGGPDKKTLTDYGDASWNKAGSIWYAADAAPVTITLTFKATKTSAIALYSPICGKIRHKHLDDARPELMGNMYQFAPEAIFVEDEDAGEIEIESDEAATGKDRLLLLKSCNRCGRFLPINFPDERDQLSFSNHCVAEHRRPCKHATFGRLRNVDDSLDILQLDYGYQLECRFCKKFEVNAAHNPQRTSAQMKEDGARRRAFELLLAEIYGGTPQLRYRHERGSELADDVWRRFGKSCFNCGTSLKSPRDMHLDHTRPLALLWPLDETATALCGSCNSQKRDRPPAEFYKPNKLKELSKITHLPMSELEQTHPNDDALALLLKRADWFFGDFLLRDEMTKERDGKIAGELVVKALQKVIARSKKHRGTNLQEIYERLRARM